MREIKISLLFLLVFSKRKHDQLPHQNAVSLLGKGKKGYKNGPCSRNDNQKVKL